MAEKCKGCIKINLLPFVLQKDFKDKSSCVLCIVHVQAIEKELEKVGKEG
jgi:hypothetical protein